MSNSIGAVVASGARWTTITRSTRETQITVTLKLDGAGEANIETGIGFFDHLLNALAHHALFDLDIEASGDLVVDEHHTVEDVALVFGAALAQTLGDRSGIARFGDAAVPMDESVATAVVDVGGRPYAVVDLPFKGIRAGKLPLELIDHTLESFARAAGVTLNVRGRGRNDHHLAEAAFKALGRALCAAVMVDPRRHGPASTKGALG
jgi:imidazoleglycerol-phosphate dehydratase